MLRFVLSLALLARRNKDNGNHTHDGNSEQRMEATFAVSLFGLSGTQNGANTVFETRARSIEVWEAFGHRGVFPTSN